MLHDQITRLRAIRQIRMVAGAFRDTFTWQPTSKSWTLLLESQAADGKWSTFASYTLTSLQNTA
jgi:hypothetical protein